MATTRAHIIVSGRVQGVAFRHYTQKTADSHAVKGWVRNNPDRTVEAVFEGDEAEVRAVLDWCKQGPQMARVDSVKVVWEEATGEFREFTITT